MGHGASPIVEMQTSHNQIMKYASTDSEKLLDGTSVPELRVRWQPLYPPILHEKCG
jgi:hypothetical protein